MIEFHAVSLLVGFACGWVPALAWVIYLRPKKRRRKPALGPRSPSVNLAAKAEAAAKRDAIRAVEVE